MSDGKDGSVLPSATPRLTEGEPASEAATEVAAPPQPLSSDATGPVAPAATLIAPPPLAAPTVAPAPTPPKVPAPAAALTAIPEPEAPVAVEPAPVQPAGPAAPAPAGRRSKGAARQRTPAPTKVKPEAPAPESKGRGTAAGASQPPRKRPAKKAATRPKVAVSAKPAIATARVTGRPLPVAARRGGGRARTLDTRRAGAAVVARAATRAKPTAKKKPTIKKPTARADKARRAVRGSRTAVKTVNLALQGGGSHGAFAWGVLDRLLEDGRIALEGVSATSAGAMNAVVLAHGLACGGRHGARETLAAFWRGMSDAAAFSPLQPTPLDRLMQNHALEGSPAFLAFDMLSRLWSPYQINPFNLNPWRDVLVANVDFDRLRAEAGLKLFLGATNVRTGKVKVFERKDIGPEAVLAASCMPFLCQAVEIDGEHYWDGGYMGNPALYPLIYGCDAPDVIVVHINPIYRAELPFTAQEILNRINEISFNASLMREMRAIAFATRLIDEGRVRDGALKQMHIHAIDADDVLRTLSVSSKLNADYAFLTHLRDAGREAADAWLRRNFAHVGTQSTVDIRATYL